MKGGNGEGRPVFSGRRLNDLRLSPQRRLCPRFDRLSMSVYPTGTESGMGFPVVDNCVEEHIM